MGVSPMCMCMYYVCDLCRRVHEIPGNLSYRWSQIPMWVLGTKPRSSRRTANTLLLSLLFSPLAVIYS